MDSGRVSGNVMQICVLVFAGHIYWRLSSSDPIFYELPQNPGVRFISPLMFPAIEKMMDAKPVHQDDELFYGYVDGDFLGQTVGVAFEIDAEHTLQYRPGNYGRFASYFNDENPPLIEVAAPLLKSLRHLSKQTEMPKGGDDLLFWEWLEVGELPLFSPPVAGGMRWHSNRKIVETAVKREHIDAACKQPSRAPIYVTLFLDAISAHSTRDFRKSILYSAMALETASAMVLDEHYEANIRPYNSKKWRVVEYKLSGGKSNRKDPIWDLLRQQEDANSLLNEAALYVLGRSLHRDNEQLFQLVTRLRSTRNKIVHRGEPPDYTSNLYLTIDAAGSSDALNCTNEVLRWLGVGEDYKLHESGFIDVSLPSAPDSKTGVEEINFPD